MIRCDGSSQRGQLIIWELLRNAASGSARQERDYWQRLELIAIPEMLCMAQRSSGWFPPERRVTQC
jgi:hypothetical protein